MPVTNRECMARETVAGIRDQAASNLRDLRSGEFYPDVTRLGGVEFVPTPGYDELRAEYLLALAWATHRLVKGKRGTERVGRTLAERLRLQGNNHLTEVPAGEDQPRYQTIIRRLELQRRCPNIIALL